jgi:hypothetical protein
MLALLERSSAVGPRNFGSRQTRVNASVKRSFRSLRRPDPAPMKVWQNAILRHLRSWGESPSARAGEPTEWLV